MTKSSMMSVFRTCPYVSPWTGCLPNMVLMAAADEADLARMVATSVAYNEGPMGFRYARGEATGIEIPENPQALEIGKGRILREGTRIALLSYGTRLGEAMMAADQLETLGLSATVADARFAKTPSSTRTPLLKCISRQGSMQTALLRWCSKRSVRNWRRGQIWLEGIYAKSNWPFVYGLCINSWWWLNRVTANCFFVRTTQTPRYMGGTRSQRLSIYYRCKLRDVFQRTKSWPQSIES